MPISEDDASLKRRERGLQLGLPRPTLCHALHGLIDSSIPQKTCLVPF